MVITKEQNMTERKKFGFSLVEVMIFFTLLAVITAASIPMMTRKSRPTPRSISHGVYVCIRNDSDAESYTEAYYNSFVRLSTNNNAASCSFNIPRADEYKIELYSAGAGGNRHADYTSQQNDARQATFTRHSATNFTNGYSLSSLLGNLAHMPTNDEFKTAFSGTSATISNFSGNGGRGANQSVTYSTPSENHCLYNGGYFEDVEAPKEVKAENVNEFGLDYYLDAYNTNSTGIPYVINPNVKISFTSYVLGDYCAKRHLATYNFTNETSRFYLGKPVATRAALANTFQRTMTQQGGEGGRGRWLSLTYNILPDESNKSFYRDKGSYPFIHYFADVTGNRYGHGYQKASCSENITYDPDSRDHFSKQRTGTQNNISTNLTNCTANTVPATNASNGSGLRERAQFGPGIVTGNANEKDAEPFYYYYGRNGSDATRYAAFKTPKFENSLPVYQNGGSAEFVTNQTKRATGGEGGIIGIAYGYPKNNDGSMGTISNSYKNIISNIILEYTNVNMDPYTVDGTSEDDYSYKIVCYKGDKNACKNYAEGKMASLYTYAANMMIGYNNYSWFIYRGVWGPRGSSNYTQRYKQAKALNGQNAEVGNTNPTKSATYYNLRPGGAENEISDDYPFVKITDNLWTKTYHIGNPGGIGRHATYRASSLGTRCNMTVPRGGRPVEDSTTAQALATMQSNLSTRMVCTDGQGNVLFNETLQGGQYNRNNREVVFNWSQNAQDNGFTASPSNVGQMQYFFPQWSRVFDIVGGVSFLIRGFRVGQAGSGMTIQDRCTVPRGEFSMIPYMENNPNTPAGTGIRNTENEGFKNGYQCYNANETLENMENNANLFSITGRTDQNGGPGAVIVSW